MNRDDRDKFLEGKSDEDELKLLQAVLRLDGYKYILESWMNDEIESLEAQLHDPQVEDVRRGKILVELLALQRVRNFPHDEVERLTEKVLKDKGHTKEKGKDEDIRP